METALEHKTMENRYNTIIALNMIAQLAESEIVRARNIPILDDEEHADYVQGYADRVEEILMDMGDLAKFGRI